MAELLDYLEDVLVWIKDREGRYQWVNRAFLLSYAAEDPARSARLAEVVGKTDYDLSPAFLADQFRLDDERVLAGRRVARRVELVAKAKGPTTWNVTHKVPLRDDTGTVVGTIGMTRPLSLRELPRGGGWGPVLSFLQDHYAESVPNPKLAKLARMSLRAFERKFFATFHLTPQRYIRRLRLRLAARVLVATDLPIVEVALNHGFADQSHFAHEFRRAYGRSPREYRAHYRAGEP